MTELRSRLETVNESDKVMDAIDRRSAWASFLPLKLRLSIGAALVVVPALILEDRLIYREPGQPLFYAAVGVSILVLGAVVTLIDHIATKRRRAAKRAPASFE